MDDWRKVLIPPDADLRETLRVIDGAGTGISLVVDDEGRLLGTVSDGDVRRALIAGADLRAQAYSILNPEPRVARPGQSRSSMLDMLRDLGLHQLPIVDEAGRAVGLVTLDEILRAPERPHEVVIMAGGLGQRLSELTRDTPKPMLKVGSRPILETIILNYAGQGFRRFWLSVNYKAEQIEAHFGDGSHMGLDIRYLRETTRLGTGGALSLLPETPSGPIMVSNGDVLSKEDYGAVLDAHMAADAQATVLVRDYEIQVPFGVVSAGPDGVTALQEKPTQRFLINAGVYVLAPEALALVPRDTFFDLPTLLERMLEAGMKVRTHRAEAYWMDIGRLPDFERANAEFKAVFG